MMELLKLETPERFKGIFQQEHKPCASCTKYVYDHLKKQKARRSLARNRPQRLCPYGVDPDDVSTSDSEAALQGLYADEASTSDSDTAVGSNSRKRGGVRKTESISSAVLSRQRTNRKEKTQRNRRQAAMQSTTAKPRNEQECAIVPRRESRKMNGFALLEGEASSPLPPKKIITLELERATPWPELKQMHKEYLRRFQAGPNSEDFHPRNGNCHPWYPAPPPVFVQYFPAPFVKRFPPVPTFFY